LTLRENIENVACGQYYTVVIAKNQKDIYNIHVFGDNKHGQLGFCPKIFSEMRLWQPICIPLPEIQLDMPIQIHAGWSHINILNSNYIKFFSYYIINLFM